jgi:hypothetical protein
MNAIRITYLIRVSDSAFMEVSPAEIQEFMAQGLTLDIRVVEEGQ